MKNKNNCDNLAYLLTDAVDSEITNLNTHTCMHTVYVELPSQEEFIKENSPSTLNWKMNKWSEAKYVCPKCQTGAMRKELDMIYTSNPPCFRYECDQCGYSTFHNF